LPRMPPKRAPTMNIRELYHSPNGDRWYLARDPDAGRVFVKHQANMASGGHIAEIEIGAFLNQGNGPEHQELLRLIGTLLQDARPPTETHRHQGSGKKVRIPHHK
jgi:hypothetical protein